METNAHPVQTLFLRPRFNVVAARGGMQVEVRVEPQREDRPNLLTSFLPGREKAQA